MYFAFLVECEMYIAFMAILQLDSRPLRPRPFKISQVGVAMDDERQMSTLHPKQRGEHAGPLWEDVQVDGFVSKVSLSFCSNTTKIVYLS